MKKLSIVLLSKDYLPNIGGVAAHVHGLARSIVSAGHWVRVITRERSSWRKPRTWITRSIVRDGVEVLEIATLCLPGGHGEGWRWRHGAGRVFTEASRDGGTTVLHTHSGSPWWVRAQNCVHVFTNHTSTFLQDVENGQRSKWQQQFTRYHWVIAPSRELAQKTVELGYQPERVSYIPNGVDTQRFKPDPVLRCEVRRELGIAESETVILCARRFVPKNGVIDFAHSLRYLTAEENPANLGAIAVIFAGNNEYPKDGYEKETVAAIRQSNVGRRAHLLGQVPNSLMHRLYAAADISVLPSLKEATSITGLESMACGLPIVGTKVGGIPDLVTDEENGLLVEHGDPRCLAAALNRLAVNADLRRAMGRCARQKAVEQFDWRHIASRTLEVYAQAAEVHRRSLSGSLGPRPRRRPSPPEADEPIAVSADEPYRVS